MIKGFTLLSVLIYSSPILAQTPPHLDLEMTSSGYRKNLKVMALAQKGRAVTDEPAISEGLQLGDRLSKWISVINSKRDPKNAIRLTSAQTRRGIPIDRPNTYSPSIIKKDIDKALRDLPVSMKKVLSGTELPSEDISIDDETFIKHARIIDRIYQSAARYKSLNPYRMAYVRRASQDVRGHYYLTKNNITSHELRDVSLIDPKKVVDIKDALTQICINNAYSSKTCEQKVAEAFRNNTVSSIYDTYYPASKKLWDSFFEIPSYGRRKDIRWTNSVMTVPFNNPSIPKFRPYLQDNIEDEFRFQNWALKLNFGAYTNGPRLIFEASVVPHVNRLGGNEIVMDSNQAIEEYESQWTIRHEFGHVLGLPDCYHEFYDEKLQAYVNYQLDTTDLMCSRAGDMKERIYQELKRTYQ